MNDAPFEHVLGSMRLWERRQTEEETRPLGVGKLGNYDAIIDIV